MDKIKVGIILGSTREGRVSEQVGNWVLENAKNDEVEYEVVDLRDYDLPFVGTSKDMTEVQKWNQKLTELDGFVFIVSEYNHSISGVLKNALDSARDAWNNKAAGLVSYGSAGGARAAEHLRGILAELQIASVGNHVVLSLFDDFEQWTTFKPRPLHVNSLNDMLNQLTVWAKATKTLR